MRVSCLCSSFLCQRLARSQQFQDNCPAWHEWELWSSCSTTCGSGQRSRKRQCNLLNRCEGEGTQIEPCETKVKMFYFPIHYIFNFHSVHIIHIYGHFNTYFEIPFV